MAVITAPAPPVQSDEYLLARFTAGERDALEELFQRYRVMAYRVAYRLLGQDADALDAVQDGFVKALTHLQGFRRQSSFKTWLLRVVSNAALDLGRSAAGVSRFACTDPTECTGPTVRPDFATRPRDSNVRTCASCLTRRSRFCRRHSGRRLCFTPTPS